MLSVHGSDKKIFRPVRKQKCSNHLSQDIGRLGAYGHIDKLPANCFELNDVTSLQL